MKTSINNLLISTKASDDPRQLDAFPARRSRKQLCPQRALSSNDPSVGRVLTLNFRSTDDWQMNKAPVLDSGFGRNPSSVNGSVSARLFQSLPVSRANQQFEDPGSLPHLTATLMPFPPVSSLKCAAESGPARKDFSSGSTSDPESSVPSCQAKPASKALYSLANQYLDTMVMDDRWRRLCLKKIRQSRDHRHARQPSQPKPTSMKEQAQSEGGLASGLRGNKRKTRRSLTLPPTPPISPKLSYRRKSDDSDSGFVSSSPTPLPPTSARVRPTRKCPIELPAPTPLVDISVSMVGRSCLSCGCANTTCWRRMMGGIICNSCGLRYPHLVTALT